MMRLYKSQILKPNQVDGHVVNLEPRILNLGVPEQAVDTAEHLNEDFKLDDLVVKQTGLSELQKKNLEESIETEVLKRLKTVEEKAFAEAHKLGLEEGKREAFNHYSAQIQNSLENLNNLLQNFEKYKNQMFIENEEFFVKLIYHIAKHVTLKEIKEDPSIVKGVLQKVLDDTHSDEEMTLKVNKDDLDFLNTIAPKDKKSWELNKKLKIEAHDDVSRGGCILETNHGIIDAQVEQRLNKAWGNIEARIPKVNPA